MKKLTALLCSVFIIVLAIYFPVNAQYSSAELENAVLSAVSWTGNKPLNNVGSEASDISVIAMSRAGINFDYSQYLKGLENIAGGYHSTDNVSDMQRTAMSVVASGGDAEYIAERDLVADSTYYRGDTLPLGSNGVIDYIGALKTLDAGAFNTPDDWTVNDRDSLVSEILSAQLSDGSFNDDVYTTAAAIIALAPYNNNVEYIIKAQDGQNTTQSCGNAIYKAVKYLSEHQSSDGDFYTSIDTAMVSMAVDAIGIGQSDERFTKDKNTVMDGLLTYRNTDGGFSNDYNTSDALATAYAMCAMVSNLRSENKKADFFDFTSTDNLGIGSSQTNSGTSSTTVRSAATAKPSATVKPSATTRPRATTSPKSTTKPKTTLKPSVSPTVKPTPTPTVKPDLVGPVQQIGPIPVPTPTQEPLGGDDTENGTAIVPVIAAIAALLAAAAAAVVYMYRKNTGIFKAKEENKEIYKAKQHRKTEEHRKYEQRRQYEVRGKYKGSRRK